MHERKQRRSESEQRTGGADVELCGALQWSKLQTEHEFKKNQSI